MLSSRATNNLLHIESISSRILLIEPKGNPKTTIICIYSPTNASSEEDIDNFYATLKATVEQVPVHNFLLIAGDFNAKLGGDVAR